MRIYVSGFVFMMKFPVTLGTVRAERVLAAVIIDVLDDA